MKGFPETLGGRNLHNNQAPNDKSLQCSGVIVQSRAGRYIVCIYTMAGIVYRCDFPPGMNRQRMFLPSMNKRVCNVASCITL